MKDYLSICEGDILFVSKKSNTTAKHLPDLLSERRAAWIEHLVLFKFFSIQLETIPLVIRVYCLMA